MIENTRRNLIVRDKCKTIDFFTPTRHNLTQTVLCLLENSSNYHLIITLMYHPPFRIDRPDANSSPNTAKSTRTRVENFWSRGRRRETRKNPSSLKGENDRDGKVNRSPLNAIKPVCRSNSTKRGWKKEERKKRKKEEATPVEIEGVSY